MLVKETKEITPDETDSPLVRGGDGAGSDGRIIIHKNNNVHQYCIRRPDTTYCIVN
ncbi:hypothetical protein J6590_049515 [Homalodisca vitripennis]|nr:hypothetical protein J6590_049515 [Homalodisca vitripennis]